MASLTVTKQNINNVSTSLEHPSTETGECDAVKSSTINVAFFCCKFCFHFCFQFVNFHDFPQTSVRKNPASSNIVQPCSNTANLFFIQSSQFKQKKTLMFLMLCSCMHVLSFQVYLQPSHLYSLVAKLFSLSNLIAEVEWR